MVRTRPVFAQTVTYFHPTTNILRLKSRKTKKFLKFDPNHDVLMEKEIGAVSNNPSLTGLIKENCQNSCLPEINITIGYWTKTGHEYHITEHTLL